MSEQLHADGTAGSTEDASVAPVGSADPADPASPENAAPPAPETGDLVIDAALRNLADAPPDDLDAQVEQGEQVQRTLQGRLSDLGG